MMDWGVSQPKGCSCSVVWWYGSGYFCIFCQIRVVFYYKMSLILTFSLLVMIIRGIFIHQP